jgi:hypothetical protein
MNTYFNSARRNMSWFRNSPIMTGGGTWGVGERLLLTKNNTALQEIHDHFPVVTSYADGLEVLEQRRSDCNFEAALLFYLAGKYMGSKKDSDTAKDLLDFLYFRSGLLNRMDDRSLIGGWTWTHIQRNFNLWIDDNGWVCTIQLLMAKLDKSLDKTYEMTKWGKLLAADLLRVFSTVFDENNTGEMKDSEKNPDRVYAGRLELPHWAVPVITSLLLYQDISDKKSEEYQSCQREIDRYIAWIMEKIDVTNSSELGYLMILAGAMLFFPKHAKVGEKLADKVYNSLMTRIEKNPFGYPPAEHYEAPIGEHLVDLIYTVNWVYCGMALAAWKNPKYLKTAQKLGKFLASIQDDGSERVELKGCWRGMYDCKNQTYGGGNCYEGGAGSIYSGWTNAPIAMAMILVGVLSKRK